MLGHAKSGNGSNTCTSTIRDIGVGSAASHKYASETDDNSFDAVRTRCLKSGKLWEDPDFPAVAESLFYSNPPSAWPDIQWKRPHEICSNPQLFVDDATRGDVKQGILGDCWLLAAVASLTTNQTLLDRVVPPDQSFDQLYYAGIFRFCFWQYGRWVEVLIDDRLPTTRNQLIYMHSDDKNEFWSALLEKAVAKLHGSYESLCGGLTSEALTDFTGGVVVRFDLRDKTPKDLLQIMIQAHDKGSLMGCSIDAGENEIEGKLTNGLIVGHAYSITAVRQIRFRRSHVALVRVRNPWGDSHEWNGAWSDKSVEWHDVGEDDKQKLGLTFDHDGEFWMSFEDFVREFERLEICHLGPDSMSSESGGCAARKWEGSLFEGSWKRRVNAGGCQNNKATFWTNPQYQVTVVDPDSDDEDGNGSIIVGLMQKDRRKLRKEGKNDLDIGYSIYEAPKSFCGTLDAEYFRTHRAVARYPQFVNLREVCQHHKMSPGSYVIVPSTFEPNEEGEFILRVFGERKASSDGELDDTTSVVGQQTADINSNGKAPSQSRLSNSDDGSNVEKLRESFLKIAGDDEEIDAFEVQAMLNSIFTKEFRFDGFSTDMTRSMVALCDSDRSGKLGFEDFRKLWTDLKTCVRAFRTMDYDHSGYFDSYEFRTALKQLGFKVSNAMFSTIVLRYSDKDGHVVFDDFVAAYIKLRTLFETHDSKDPSGTGKITFSLEEFSTMHMYS